jgi:hypothetical protein
MLFHKKKYGMEYERVRSEILILVKATKMEAVLSSKTLVTPTVPHGVTTQSTTTDRIDKF